MSSFHDVPGGLASSNLGADPTEGGFDMSEPQQAQRRARTVRLIRRSTELEGSRSTSATRADQDAYARGAITAAELGDRVRSRYNIQ